MQLRLHLANEFGRNRLTGEFEGQYLLTVVE